MQPTRTVTDDQVAEESYTTNDDDSSVDPHTDNIDHRTSPEPMITTQHGDMFSHLRQTWPDASLHFPTNTRHSPRPTHLASDFSPIYSEYDNTFPDQSTFCTRPNQEGNRKTEFLETPLGSSQRATENVEDLDDTKLDHNCDENNNLGVSVTPSADGVNQPENDRTLDNCLMPTRRLECSEKRNSVDLCRLFLECKSPRYVLSPPKNCLLKFACQPQCVDFVLPCVAGRISPPVWTSLALRENIAAREEIIRPSPQMPIIRNGFVVNLSNVFQPIRESSSGDDLRGGGGGPRCWSSSSEGVSYPGCADSRRTSQDSSYNNNSSSSDGGAWDFFDDCRPAESDNTADDDSDLVDGGGGLCLACRRGHSPALGNLDSFLAALPAFRDRGESPLADIIIVRERIDSTALEAAGLTRPGNPVADVLKYGGNEHFLPIDIIVHEGDVQEL